MKHFVFLLAASFCLFFSCVHEGDIINPYFVGEAKVFVGEEKGVFSFAGAYIDFYNNSQKNISSVDFSFCLYDKNGASVGFSGNMIESSFSKRIEGESSKTFIVNLDKVLGPYTDSEYKIDFVRIKKIEYEDGSIWENIFLLSDF